jgi:methionyl-tRNA synthetase
MGTKNSRLLIIGPPPTPNGDLHIGHIAGPYMSADVLRAWALLQGREAKFVTGTDDSQTFVVSSARKLGLEPATLAAQSTAAIRRSLNEALIDVDGFASFDAGYESTVRAFLDPLHAAGLLTKKVRALPWDPLEECFLVEGLVSGECPHCLAEARGGLCETCGQPVACETLRGARSVLSGNSKLEFRETGILVLELEQLRGRIEAFYGPRRLAALRPGARRIIERALASSLPDFPITYPLSWGIPAHYPEVPGQVFNAWAEGMAASMYCTAAASDGAVETGMRAWQDRQTDLVYFLGLDNVYFWGLTHLAMLLAHGDRYILPVNYFSNHFYELDDEKISTSRGHVVLMGDLLEEFGAAAVRFFLCWTAPEVTERSFSRETFVRVTERCLILPWNRVCQAVQGVTITPAMRTEAAAEVALMQAEMETHMSLAAFSTAGAARMLAKHIGRLDRLAAGQQCAALGGLAVQFQALARLADPILKQDNCSVAAEDRHPQPLVLRIRRDEFRLPGAA